MSENSDHARRWASLITSDTDAVLGLFADDVLYDDRRNIDHVFDTATSKTELRERLAPFANADPGNGLGIHRFDVLDVIDATGVDGSRAVAILWKWTGEHLENFRGVPTGGQDAVCPWADLAPVRRRGKGQPRVHVLERRAGVPGTGPAGAHARVLGSRLRLQLARPVLVRRNRLVGEHRCFPRSGVSVCVCRP